MTPEPIPSQNKFFRGLVIGLLICAPVWLILYYVVKALA